MAEKLTELRKKYGWTQEYLAEQLGVSRQAISKWESAQSVPDLKNLEKMSYLFGVSTDFLIKDDMDMTEISPVEEAKDINGDTLRSVSLQEANDYLAYTDKAATKIALGVALCILAFIPLVVLGILSEIPQMGIGETKVALIGLPLLFVFLIPAIVMFIAYGIKGNRFAYLKKERIDTAYGVSGMVRERKAKLESELIIHITSGVVLCILAMVIIIAGGSLAELWDARWQTLVGLALALIACAVFLFVSIGIRQGALQVLLQEGKRNADRHKADSEIELIAGIYWPTITIVYLAYSFISYDWGRSWLIWPLAGLLFGIISIVINARGKENRHK